VLPQAVDKGFHGVVGAGARRLVHQRAIAVVAQELQQPGVFARCAVHHEGGAAAHQPQPVAVFHGTQEEAHQPRRVAAAHQQQVAAFQRLEQAARTLVLDLQPVHELQQVFVGHGIGVLHSRSAPEELVDHRTLQLLQAGRQVLEVVPQAEGQRRGQRPAGMARAINGALQKVVARGGDEQPEPAHRRQARQGRRDRQRLQLQQFLLQRRVQVFQRLAALGQVAACHLVQRAGRWRFDAQPARHTLGQQLVQVDAAPIDVEIQQVLAHHGHDPAFFQQGQQLVPEALVAQVVGGLRDGGQAACSFQAGSRPQHGSTKCRTTARGCPGPDGLPTRMRSSGLER
jgi:hypothetical protein